MKLVVLTITAMLSLQAAQAQIFNDAAAAVDTDSALAPIISVKPDSFSVEIDDTTKFVVSEVKILNWGGSPLIVERVQGSCGCATAAVVDPVVYPMAIGKMTLNLNVKGLSAGENTVEYLVYSNASNNPYSIKVYCNSQGNKQADRPGSKVNGKDLPPR